jgi:hypothetical protein
MDVKEDGVNRAGCKGPEGLGAGGGAEDGADAVVPPQEEGQFLDGGQLVIDDEDVNHVPRVLSGGSGRFTRRAPAATSGPAW